MPAVVVVAVQPALPALADLKVLPVLPVLPVLLVLLDQQDQPALLARLANPARPALPQAFALTPMAVLATGMAIIAGDTQITHSGVAALTTMISLRIPCAAFVAVAVLPVQIQKIQAQLSSHNALTATQAAPVTWMVTIVMITLPIRTGAWEISVMKTLQHLPCAVPAVVVVEA